MRRRILAVTLALLGVAGLVSADDGPLVPLPLGRPAGAPTDAIWHATAKGWRVEIRPTAGQHCAGSISILGPGAFKNVKSEVVDPSEEPAPSGARDAPSPASSGTSSGVRSASPCTGTTLS